MNNTTEELKETDTNKALRKTMLKNFIILVPVCLSCISIQCAEGFLQAALEAETVAATQKWGDEAPPAKKPCKPVKVSHSKTSKVPSE